VAAEPLQVEVALETGVADAMTRDQVKEILDRV
jgi:hypothetical protein